MYSAQKQGENGRDSDKETLKKEATPTTTNEQSSVKKEYTATV